MSLSYSRPLLCIQSTTNNTRNSTRQKAIQSNDINSHTQETTAVKQMSLQFNIFLANLYSKRYSQTDMSALGKYSLSFAASYCQPYVHSDSFVATRL